MDEALECIQVMRRGIRVVVWICVRNKDGLQKSCQKEDEWFVPALGKPW